MYQETKTYKFLVLEGDGQDQGDLIANLMGGYRGNRDGVFWRCTAKGLRPANTTCCKDNSN